jgi:putative MATE family efflux protein
MRDRILNGDVIRTSLSLAWPVMLSNAFETVYNLTDAFWLGKVGPESVAAPSISWPILFLFISLSAGFGIAGLSMVAQYTGAGKPKKANKVAGQLLSTLVIASICVAIFGYLLVENILMLMNIPSKVLGITASYLRITFLGLPFMFSFFGFQALLRGYGDTKTPMIISISAAFLDTILDPFFIFGWFSLPEMGVAGAALTTSITRGLAGVVGLYLLFSGKVGLKLKLSDLKPDLSLMKRIISVGIPASIGQSGTALGFVVLTSLVAIEDSVLGGGGTLLGAYGIGNRISSIVFIIVFGGTSAISTMIGQNLGANQEKRASDIAKKMFLVFVSFSIIECVIVYSLRFSIFQFFINDQNVIEIGSIYITYFIPSLPFFTAFRLSTSVLEGAGSTKASMILSLFRLWGLRIPLAYILYFLFRVGAIGIWIGLTTGNVVAALISIAWISKGNWKRKII